MIELTDLGWDVRWADAFAPHAEAGLVPGRVAIEFNHIYRVLIASGELQVQHSGRILHRATGRHDLAAVGDWVAIRQTAGEKTGTIEAILPRRSKFSRKVAGEVTEEQVVAANIDVVFLVMGLDRDFNPRRLERYLMMAYESGATPVVILTKADLLDNAEEKRAEIVSLAPGTAVHAVTAIARTLSSGDVVPPDVRVLFQHLSRGRTAALLGSSGAGKSTLINAIAGTETLKTGAVRAKDSRGRHTTRHRQLIPLAEHGLLVDTPGMRELQLWDLTDASQETFDDVQELSAACHFSDCQHRDEPRCAVKAAIAEGSLAADRLAGYIKLQDERRAFAVRRDVRAQIEKKRKLKTVGRAIKQLYKDRGRLS